MMDSISGATPLNVLEVNSVASVDGAPPTGKSIAVSDLTPDVSVAISELAQARMESMAAPSDASRSATMTTNPNTGGVNFGVDKGGFEWPLNAGSETTAEAAQFESEGGWDAQGEVVNGVLQADANESAYIALGKSTVSASN